MMEDSGNIQQRVFDLFPPYPRPITLYTILSSLPFEKRSITRAIEELKKKKRIEAEPYTRRGVYRRRVKANRPIDMRGHHGNSGRRAHQ